MPNVSPSPVLRSRNHSRSLAPALSAAVGALSFAVYYMTMAPGLQFIDSGELATVAALLGIAHPTGYPLFTLVGWMFAHLPVGGAVIFRLNMMAAALCAAGASFWLLSFRRVILLCRLQDVSERLACAAATSGALMLAFSRTYWSQALEIEVYPLHLLLSAIIVLAFLRANFPFEGERVGIGRWYAFAFAVGLGFANHMSTILLAPALLAMFFLRNGRGAETWKLLAKMTLPFAGALSLYLYLPIRASQSPALNWGNVVTFERFLWHVSGKQYRVWMFSSFDAAWKQFSYFLDGLPGEFTFAGLLLSIVGIVLTFRSKRSLGTGVLLFFLGCIVYAVNYDIHDIDSYFLLAYVAEAMAASVGIAALARALQGRLALPGAISTLVVLLLPLAPLVANWHEVDEHTDHLVEDYTANMFASLRPNAVVLSYQWDYWVAAAYYVQNVDSARRDVLVIDKELLRRSWYLKQLENRDPQLIAASRQEVSAFLHEVDRFEHDLPYDPEAIERAYRAMILSLIRQGMASRPVYVTAEIEAEYTAGFQRVPEGLAFRLESSPGALPGPMPQMSYRPSPRTGRLEDMVRKLYADAYLSRGEYFLILLHDPIEARKCLETASSFDPSSARLRRLGSLLMGR